MASKAEQCVYRAILNSVADTAGAQRAKVLDAKIRYHRSLNLHHPTTLSDKISWMELNTDQTLVARCTDKWDVRNYVSQKGLADTLIPAYGPWERAEDIDFDELPRSFVLKATHGCEMNYIVPDKSSVSEDDLIAHARHWLANDYGRACVEPHYKLVPHRVYAEDFVGGMDAIIDYKFHCFNGVPQFVLTCSERNTGLKLNVYDLDWNPLDGLQGPMKNDKQMARPTLLEDMTEIAKVLSGDFDFVRVDLYEVANKVMFGELTFTPAGGILSYFDDEFNLKWGEKLETKALRR